MSSIIEGYNYDIFISYRQKDNKGDKWVSEFVESLKTELESTFKEEITVYFDINPHDGLLETHDVDASLKEKLKCLIFIPIISRTYCDPKSFAWEHEFKAFVEQASKDQFGLKVKLPNGNVATRILPVQIHDLYPEDKSLLEKEIGGVLRAIEFIYKEQGVNRPLTANDDKDISQGRPKYRNQINKVANAIDEIIHCLKGKEPAATDRKVLADKTDFVKVSEDNSSSQVEIAKKSKRWLIVALSTILCIVGVIAIYKVISSGKQTENIAKHEKSIAVLPFKLLSDEPDKQYLADGMMDAITLHLSKIKDLRVMSRTSVEQYRGATKTTRQIGKELGVEYLLEGSFQKFGDNTKLIVQLIRASEERHAWGNEYNSKWNDVFSLQSEVAQTIARELDAVITPEEKQVIEIIPTTNLTAYDFYQRGSEEYWNFIITGKYRSLERVKELYNKALEYDSAFAKAYAGLASVYYYKHLNASETYFTENYLDSVKILSDQALSHDTHLSEAYMTRAIYNIGIGNPDQAIIEFDKAIKYNPNSWEAYLWKGNNVYIDDLDNMDYVKGLECLHKAASLNHGRELQNIYNWLGYTYAFCAGFPDEGKKYYNEAFLLNRDSAYYLSYIGSVEIQYGNYDIGIEKSLKAYSKDSLEWRLAAQYFFHGEYKESLKYYRKYFERLKLLGKIPQGDQDVIGYAYLQNGYKKEAEYWFNEQIRLSQEAIKLRRYYSTSVHFSDNAYIDLASVFACRGEKEKALELLRMFDRYPVISKSMLDDIEKYSPMFNSIRNEPEFQEIVKRWEAKYQSEHERVRKWLEEQSQL